MIPLIGDLGTPELLIILAVVVLMFGSSKLPELARGSGRAIRIFKAETKGLMDDDDEAEATDKTDKADAPATSTTTNAAVDPAVDPAAAELEARRADLARQQKDLARRQKELDAQRDALRPTDLS